MSGLVDAINRALARPVCIKCGDADVFHFSRLQPDGTYLPDCESPEFIPSEEMDDARRLELLERKAKKMEAIR